MAQISGHRGSSHRGRAWRRGLVAAALGLGALASLSPVAARALASEESFPNGRPGCENTFIDFSDPGVLSQSPYDVKSWHKVVSEEPNGHNNVAITNGALEIKIVKS